MMMYLYDSCTIVEATAIENNSMAYALVMAEGDNKKHILGELNKMKATLVKKFR